ncbi:MAG: repressor in the phenylacetic acid catabolic pathway, partial [uncultured bacterium]
IKLTLKEILLSFIDVGMKINEIAGYRMHKRIAHEYFRSRNTDKIHLSKKLWEMEKRGYIKRFKREKENYLKLTPIGKEKALKYFSDDFKIKTPKVWDKKWRIVIFDIPNDKKNLRDIIRNRLKKIGFYQLQKSVFVYPFECLDEIRALKYIYCLGPYTQYILAEIIESEIDLVDYFYDQGILDK